MTFDSPLGELRLIPIEERHDQAMARIIRDVMREFGASGSGFSSTDPEVDGLTQSYAIPHAGFFVWEAGGHVVGGGGHAPLRGQGGSVCELRKMYLLPEARGRGLGARLLDHLLTAARADGYRQIYIESFRTMQTAIRLYASRGFRRLEAPLGSTGHHACDVWMLLDER